MVWCRILLGHCNCKVPNTSSNWQLVIVTGTDTLTDIQPLQPHSLFNILVYIYLPSFFLPFTITKVPVLCYLTIERGSVYLGEPKGRSLSYPLYSNATSVQNLTKVQSKVQKLIELDLNSCSAMWYMSEPLPNKAMVQSKITEPDWTKVVPTIGESTYQEPLCRTWYTGMAQRV